ncbi:hypothetical protein [Mesorhizobium sp. LjNodule214]|uniref:hypothetical protein n=1 Tax=Mesorhizobium sp. LjNodule214 TaxID=3342252 RepID=UPI003ED02064
MALTNAEHQRLYRERKKQRQKAAAEATTNYLKLPFSDYFSRADWSVGQQCLDEVGVAPPTFDADEDPQWREDWNEYGGMEYRGSIGRAERMVGAFLDAATDLARIINQYKLEQIDQAISELGDLDISDSARRRKAFEEAARLHNIRDRLDRTIRWSLREYQIKD